MFPGVYSCSMANFIYYLLYGFFRAMALLPLRVLYLLSDLFYLLAFYFPGYRKRVVFENLNNSFPEKSPEEINRIARKFYSHLCDLVIESIYLTGMGEEEIGRRVKYKNPWVVEKYFSEGRHTAAVLGHFGNWEWMCGYPLQTGYKCVVIYRQLKNRIFDRLMLNVRSRFGAIPVPMKMAIRKIYELDNQGVPTITAFMADQTPPREKSLYWVDFLNQDTPVYLGVERMARKIDMAVVYFRMKKVKRGYYEFEFIPLFDEGAATSEEEITNAHVKLLEKQIRETPEYWLWSHRRWKIKR
jgi:Kdo2-lipid IVA lauroyltransferase/acyltransferase